MVQGENNSFWWEDHNCLADTIQNMTVAPICQYDTTTESTTSPQETTTTIISDCPSGWSEFQGHCYHLSNDHIDWRQAEEVCLSYGSHLASVHSGAEYDFILYLTSGLPAYTWIWLGGSDLAMEVGEKILLCINY